MTLSEIKEKFAAKIIKHPEIRTCLKFDLGADGQLFVDTTQSPPLILEEDREAAIVLTLSKQNLEDMILKKQDPKMMFMTGKLKVKGSMGTVMQLAAIL